MPLSQNLSSRFNLPDTGSGKTELETRIFNAAALVFFLLSTTLTAVAIFQNPPIWVKLSLSFLSLIFLFIFYNAKYRRRSVFSIRIFVLLTLVLNDVAWCWSISSSYTANYLFVLIIVLNLTILKVRDHIGFMIIAVLNVIAIQYLGYRFPEEVLTNPELFENLKFPFPGFYRMISLVILIAIVLNYFKRSYEREREGSTLKSRQLTNNNAALRHRNEHLESMARMVSHNLRSPMAGLKMIVKLFDRVETAEEKTELMRNFKEGSEVMFNMIDDFSAILMDYRELVKELELIDLGDALANVKKQLAQQVAESDASIKANFKAYPHVKYSRTFLESVILNLVSNAIKYNKEGQKPQILITSYLEGNKVMLCFRDKGIGIDLDRHADKVFKMYKTFHDKEEVDSKGVGLFITKNQVEIMGGKISVDSVEGEGTTFYVELYRL